MHLMHLFEKLRILCVRYDLTQERIGEQLGVDQTTVGRWLKGSSRPYDRHARKLAELYGLKTEELLDDKVPLPSHITDGRGQILKRAAELAQAQFPNNLDAGQAVFETHVNAGHWKIAALDTAGALRKQASELIALAEKLEFPFLSPRDQGRADLAALEKSIDTAKAPTPAKAVRRHA